MPVELEIEIFLMDVWETYNVICYVLNCSCFVDYKEIGLVTQGPVCVRSNLKLKTAVFKKDNNFDPNICSSLRNYSL